MENRQELPQKKIREEEEKKPRDYMVYMITVQTVLCILIFAGIFVFSRIGGQSYANFKNNLDTIMSHDIGINGVKSAFKDAVAYVMASPKQRNNKTDETTTNVIQQKSMHLGKGDTGEKLVNGKAPQNASFAPYTITTKITNPLPKGEISSPFGYRKDPISGKRSFHGGLDIAADEGSKIVAAYSGTVKKTGKDPKAGNFVILNHGGGLNTFYCHCLKIEVAVDDKVKAGDTIAKVGSTGYSTGPHLHFEVRINGIKYNPILVLNELI